MKVRAFLSILVTGMLILSGCGNNELKKDASKIGALMCRNIEIMNQMKAANPEDSAAIAKLQAQGDSLQKEMSAVYKEFGEKYKDKIQNPEFNKSFNKELRKAMLECPHLSKQDRELFEKDLEK